MPCFQGLTLYSIVDLVMIDIHVCLFSNGCRKNSRWKKFLKVRCSLVNRMGIFMSWTRRVSYFIVVREWADSLEPLGWNQRWRTGSGIKSGKAGADAQIFYCQGMFFLEKMWGINSQGQTLNYCLAIIFKLWIFRRNLELPGASVFLLLGSACPLYLQLSFSAAFTHLVGRANSEIT